MMTKNLRSYGLLSYVWSRQTDQSDNSIFQLIFIELTYTYKTRGLTIANSAYHYTLTAVDSNLLME